MSAGTVAFEFAHKLAKISVTASLSQDLITAGYTLTTTGITADLGVQSTGGTIDPKTADAAWTAPNATDRLLYRSCFIYDYATKFNWLYHTGDSWNRGQRC